MIRRSSRILLASLLAFASLTPARRASAGPAESPTPRELPAAEALFREGHELLRAGAIAEACRRFAASVELEAAPGAVLNLALCREKEGRLATAWSDFARAAAVADRAGQPERAAFARARYADLDARLPRVRIFASADVALALDGVELAPSAHAGPLPLDPGPHEIRATREGHEPFRVSFVAEERAPLRIVRVPELAPLPHAENAPAPPPPTVSTAEPKDAPPPSASADLVAGSACLVVSAAAAALSVYELTNGAARGELADVYRGASGDEARVHALDSEAAAGRNWGIAAAGLALVSLGAGLAFLLPHGDAPPASRVTWHVVPSIGPAGGGVRWSGRF